jgi:hypothetical protein
MWHRRKIFKKQEEGVNGAERSIMHEARREKSNSVLTIFSLGI